MERIHPKERFSHNSRSLSVPAPLLQEALEKNGLNPQAFTLTQLSGGFMNANFLADGQGPKFVLRVYSTDSHFARKEFDLLKFLESRPMKTPKVFGYCELQGRPVVLMEYLAGMTLEDRLLNGPPVDLELFEAVGRELGAIHLVTFDRAGFIGPKMEIGTEFENFTEFVGRFIERTLNDLESQPQKIELESVRRFRKLVQDKWHIAVKTEKLHQLAHCDFNPKNILVSCDRSEVTGVIDWEFSDSGNGLIDIGNFFRFSYDYPPGARERFIGGYQSINANLPVNWEEASLLVDLGNMCGFLERKEDYQKSFRTARAVVKSTLDHFKY